MPAHGSPLTRGWGGGGQDSCSRRGWGGGGQDSCSRRGWGGGGQDSYCFLLKNGLGRRGTG